MWGLFFSSTSENQIIAAVSGMSFTLFMLFLYYTSQGLVGVLGDVFSELTLLAHYQPFLIGIFDVKHIVYFLVWISFSIFLTAKMLERKVAKVD